VLIVYYKPPSVVLQKMNTDFETKLQIVDDKISYIRKELARILKLKDKDEKFQSLREIIVNLRNMDLEDLKVVLPSSDDYKNTAKDIRTMVTDIQNQLLEISSYVTSNRQMMESLQAKNTDFAADLENIKTSLQTIEQQLNDKLLMETMPDSTKQMMLTSEIQQIKNQQQQMQEQLQQQQQQFKTVQGYQQQVQSQLPYYAPEQQQQVQQLQEQYNQQKERLADSMRTNYRNLEQANNAIEILQKELDELKRKCRFDNDSQRMEFTRRFQEMSQALAISEDTRRKLEMELTSSRKAIEALRNDRNNLINQINANTNAYQANINKLSTAVRNISSAYNNSKGVSDARYNAILRVLQQRNALQDKINQYASVILILSKRSRDSSNELSAAKAKINVLDPSYQALQQKFIAAKNLLQQQIDQTNILQTTVDRLSKPSTITGQSVPLTSAVVDNGNLLREVLGKLNRLDRIDQKDYTPMLDDIMQRIQNLQPIQPTQTPSKDYTTMLNDIMQRIQTIEQRQQTSLSDPKLQEILDKMTETNVLKGQISKLELQVAQGQATQQELDQIKSNLAKAIGDMARLQLELSSRDGTIVTLQTEIEQLKKVLQGKKTEQEIDNLTQEIASLKKQMAGMVGGEELEKLKKKETDLLALRQKEFDTIGALDLDAVRRKLDSIPGLERKLSTMETELENATNQLKNNLEKLQTATEKIQTLEKQIANSVGKQELEELEQEKKSLLEQKTELQAKLSGAENESVGLKRKIVANEEQMSLLRKELENAAAAQTEKEKLTVQEQEKLRKEMEELQKENTILISKLTEALSKGGSDTDNMKKLSDMISEKESIIVAKQKEIDELDRKSGG
jgi:chromosome segregation ATPase